MIPYAGRCGRLRRHLVGAPHLPRRPRVPDAGNIQDAEDVVQEAFSRLLDRDLATIDDARMARRRREPHLSRPAPIGAQAA